MKPSRSLGEIRRVPSSRVGLTRLRSSAGALHLRELAREAAATRERRLVERVFAGEGEGEDERGDKEAEADLDDAGRD
jgi:hypothetical protein